MTCRERVGHVENVESWSGFVVDDVARAGRWGSRVSNVGLPLSRGIPPLMTVIRHHVSTIVVAVLVFVGFAGFYLVSVQPTYTSSSLILLSPAPGNPLSPENASASGSQMAVAMDTEAHLLPSAAVSKAVSEDLGRTTPGVNEALDVSVPSNTQMLEITYTAGSPERAEAGAQAFADGFLAYRSKRATSGQESRVKELRRQVDDVERDLKSATSRASGDDSSSQEAPLLASRLAQLGEDLSEAESISTNPGSVINPASEVTESNELPRWIVVAAALVLGALAGLVIAVVREWRRDLVRSTDASDPSLPAWSTVVASDTGPLVRVRDKAEHEAYCSLRAAFVANAPAPQVLGVTSIGKNVSTAVITNLAVVLAEADYSVLLVAPGLEGSVVERAMGHPPRHGLVEILEERLDPRQSVESVEDGVSVLVGGHDLADSSDLLSSPAFRAMIEDLRQDFDYLLIDAGLAGAADSDALLLVTDSVVVAVPTETTTRAQVQSALARFDQLGIRALGSVRVDPALPGRGSRLTRRSR